MFMAESTNIISLFVVIIVVGKIERKNVTRKRKIDYSPFVKSIKGKVSINMVANIFQMTSLLNSN